MFKRLQDAPAGQVQLLAQKVVHQSFEGLEGQPGSQEAVPVAETFHLSSFAVTITSGKTWDCARER